jgi:hypothetical protein
MGKRNKKKRQQEEAARKADELSQDEPKETSADVPVEDASAGTSPQEAQQPESAPEEITADGQPVEPIAQLEPSQNEAIASEPAAIEAPADEEAPAEPIPDDSDDRDVDAEVEPTDTAAKPQKGFIGTYWMLIVGVGLVLAGIFSVILLRTNILQVYLLGIDEPYTGLGQLETPTQGGNMAFYVVGLIFIFVWGMRAEIPEVRARPEASEDSATDEPEPVLDMPAEPVSAEPATQVDFGHEHLPPEHLTTVQKIKHLTMAYSQGKISEGLYNENMARFEAELEAGPAKAVEAPKDYGHEHLPPAHLSPEDKIDHLTKAYAQGKISKGLYERDLARFEEELKREQLHMPPHHLGSQEKLDHLEDAYRLGRISKGTYEKNVAIFRKDIEAAQPIDQDGALDILDDLEDATATEPEPEQDVVLDLEKLTAEIEAQPAKSPEMPTPPQEDDKTLMQLDSLLEEIESGNDTPEMREKLRKKKEESFEERIMKEIEDLEDL